jgi:FkbM family methyltransferase
MKVIYDLGANNGDDIGYYLLKADKVVAIEANPFLCQLIRERYPVELESRRLVLEACAITCATGVSEVDFWIHRSNHVLSQISEPSTQALGNFDKCRLPAKSIVELVHAHGDPHYVKIDLEGYDGAVLRSLFAAGIRPPYISAECHNIEIFSILHAIGGYSAFKLIKGSTVSRTYRKAKIHVDGGTHRVSYSFPFHSAGPFGDDVVGDWKSAQRTASEISIAGVGWIDLHATSTVANPRLHSIGYSKVACMVLERLFGDCELGVRSAIGGILSALAPNFRAMLRAR